MRVRKLNIPPNGALPFIAALPYAIDVEDNTTSDGSAEYDPLRQLTVFAGRRDVSTCRSDESAGGLFSSKSDTHKDD